MALYDIIRHYRDRDDLNGKVIKRGLSLSEAQEHCRNPETSSSTSSCSKHEEAYGPWFDGYTTSKRGA